jgi:hypothetical protein
VLLSNGGHEKNVSAWLVKLDPNQANYAPASPWIRRSWSPIYSVLVTCACGTIVINYIVARSRVRLVGATMVAI